MACGGVSDMFILSINCWRRPLFGGRMCGQRDLGTSSARWVITSGVPIAKAPFSIPNRNMKPSLLHPVRFCQSRQTKELVAFSAGSPRPLSATHMMTVIMQKPIVHIPPINSRYGIIRFHQIAKEKKMQTSIMYVTKTCHVCTVSPG